MSARIGYITDDVKNVRKRDFFYYIRENNNIKLITTNLNHSLYNYDDVVIICKRNNFKEWIKRKLFYISALCKSRFSNLYHKRNYHVKKRYLVNSIHFIKRCLSLLGFLPSYSFWIEILYKNDVSYDEYIKQFDIIVFDSLLINTDSFHCFIARASRLKNIKLVADVYSWDNVHYAAMTYFADYYFVWNEEIKKRLIHDHPKLVNSNFKYVGVQYMNYLQELAPIRSVDSQEYILFAAVYADEITANVEKKIVLRIANVLRNCFPHMKLFFRPYPSMPKDFYLELAQHPFIEIKEFGSLEKRYDSGNEYIRVDNDLQNKINLIYNCKAFISLGSTFTFEVAYLMRPIVQLNLNEREFSLIHNRNKTADHIIKSFLFERNINIANNIDELSYLLKMIINGDDAYLKFSAELKNFLNLNCNGNFSVFEEKLMEAINDEP